MKALEPSRTAWSLMVLAILALGAGSSAVCAESEVTSEVGWFGGYLRTPSFGAGYLPSAGFMFGHGQTRGGSFVGGEFRFGTTPLAAHTGALLPFPLGWNTAALIVGPTVKDGPTRFVFAFRVGGGTTSVGYFDSSAILYPCAEAAVHLAWMTTAAEPAHGVSHRTARPGFRFSIDHSAMAWLGGIGHAFTFGFSALVE